MDLIERLKKKKIINEDNTFNSNKEERNNVPQKEIEYTDRLPIKKYNGGIQTNNPNVRHINANTINGNNIKNVINNVPNVARQTIWDRVQSTAKDLGYTMKNLGLGAKSGIEQSGNYIENVNENNFSNYKNMRKRQFYASNKVDEIAKSNARVQDNNILINRAKKNMSEEDKKAVENIQNNRMETNLVKKTIQNSINEDNKKIQENAENTNNSILRKVNRDLAPSIGQMGAGTALSAINPALGMSYFTTSAGGSYIDEAKQRGMSDKDAFTFGTIMGAVEGATEEVGIRNFQKAGKGIKALSKGEKLATKTAVNEVSKQTLKGVLKDYGIGIADNVMQESIIEPIQELTAQAVGGKDKANWNNMGQRMLESGINGGLVSAIVGGSNLGISSCVGVAEKVKNGQPITQQEFQQAVNDASKQLDTTKIIQDSVKQQVNKFKDYYTGKSVDKNTQNILNQAQDIINKENSKPESTQSEAILPTQQVSQEQNKIAENRNMEQILPIRYTNYGIENIDNNNIKTLVDSANQNYLQDNENTRKLINTMKDISNRNDISFKFNNELNNQGLDGKIIRDSNGKLGIEVNPNSSRALEYVVTHEVIHPYVTDEMRNIVTGYASKNADFNDAIADLKKLYGTEDITDEIVADAGAKLFGNQESLNQITASNPSFIKRVYDRVVQLLDKITGYSNEKLVLKDFKSRLETAMRENNITMENGTESYLFAGEKGLNNAIKSNTSNIIIDKAYNKAIKLKESGNTNEYIRQNTGWFQDKNGKWKFEIPDISLKIKKHLKNGEIDKLDNVISHDLLFDFYPEFKDYKIKIDNSLKNANASFNRKTNLIRVSSDLMSKEKKGTILHEIQHAIQKTEGFESGAKTGLFNSQKSYYDSLGEIEADDVKQRYLRNEYNIAPRSSKNNPKHRNLNSYMKNRNAFDKLKDSIYTATKGEMLNGQTSKKNNNSFEKIERQNGRETMGGKNIENSEKSSFSMENNRFDVTGNENLDQSGTLFFRTRDDGIYYVQATNNSGNLIYEGTFIDKKSMARTLGEDVANYIEKNSEKNINNELYIENKGNPEKDYKMHHRPSQEYGNASNFEANMDGVFEHPQWYMQMNKDYNIESLEALRKVRNNPEAEITIYRATPGDTINEGDWVTPSRKYAELHNNSQLDGKGNILELRVKAKDLLWGGDDINEFGYFPDNTKYSKQTQQDGTGSTYRNFIDKTFDFGEKGTITESRQILPTKQQPNLPAQEKIKFENDNQIQESNNLSDEQIAKILTEPVNNNNEKRKMSAFLKANLIDKGMVFEELSRKTGNRELQGKYDYTLSAEARGQNAIGNARYDMDSKTKTKKQISKSLTDIIDEVGENPSEFYNYMYHQLNIDRMTLEDRFGGDTGINYERKEAIKNKPVFGDTVTADISRKIVAEIEQKNPEFKNYAKDVYDYLDANMQELVNNGVISEELRDNLKERYPHYVPVSRVTDKGLNINVPLDTGRTGVNTPLKRAVGGNQDIKPLFQTMADRTLQTYRASAKNNFGVELKNTLEKSNQLNQSMETTDVDTIIESIADETQNKELLQEGKNGANPTFTVFENGEKITYEISKDMYDALKPKNELLKRIDNSMLSKGLNKVNNFRRGLLTEYNPVFSITNAIKDAQDVLLNSQHSSKTYSKIPEATAQIMSKGYWYKEYIQNGGEQNSYFKDGEFDKPKNNLPTKTKNVVTIPLKAISSVNNIIEMTPRLAEYIVSREQGRSIETSMLDASRVTTNFKAGGDITKTLNRNGFTFLNASVQGMQQQIRNIQEANAKGLKGWAILATKYTVAGLPALILNNLIWDDDDEYKDLQDYVKDNYYIIGKTKNGTFIRIPKGRAVATIQKIVSNADEYVNTVKSGKILDIDKLGSQFWKDLKEDISFAKDNLAPNNPMDNNILAPIIQAMTNKTWYGDELVPTRLQDKPSNEQYDESTDKLSRWIGEKTGISPIKINYLLDQYSGGVGDILLPKLTPQAENSVLEDKFTTDPTMKSKYPGNFFSIVDELKVKSNSDRATDEDILKYKYISDVSSDMSKLYKQKREIQNKNISDEEKKKQLKIVQKQINDLAKNSLSKVDSITKGNNYAQIDKNQYYKDIEGNWKAISDEDKEKNKKAGISLKTYSSYKYKMSKVKQEKVNKGELTKEQSLKNTDKMQILLDSNYSNSDKSAIYENYIKSQPKNGEVDLYKALKETNIDINQYLKYQQQEFESDKEDDGTVNGKTITNSKKSKVYEYVNSNISGYNNRLLILGSQYKLSKNEREEIYKIINTLPNTSKEERMQLYGKMKGFKVYKDGTVSF